MRLTHYIKRFIQILRNRGVSAALHETIAHLGRKRRQVKTAYLRRRHGGAVVRTVQGNQMLLDITAQGNTADLLFDKEMDLETTKRFRETLQQFDNDTTVHVFELGARHGYYSLIAASILGENGQIYAVEPIPENVERLERNIEMNEYTEIIEVIESAVGSEHGQREMLYVDTFTHRFSTNSDKGTTTSVNVKSLDTMVDNRINSTNDPVVIRLDVENAEHQAVDGMESLLQSDRQVYLFAELHNSNEYTGIKIVQTLQEHEFQIELLDADSDVDAALFAAQEENENIEIIAIRS